MSKIKSLVKKIALWFKRSRARLRSAAAKYAFRIRQWIISKHYTAFEWVFIGFIMRIEGVLARVIKLNPKAPLFLSNVRASNKIITPVFKAPNSNYPLMGPDHFNTSFKGKLKGVRRSFIGQLISGIPNSSQVEKAKIINRRILFVTRSWGFITPLLEYLDANYSDIRWETKKFDLAPIYEHLKRKKYDDISWANHFSELLNDQGNSELHRDYLRKQASIIKPEFPDAVEWADIIFVEWGNQTAVLASRMLPKDAKIIVRIHSYEAFTRFPLEYDKKKIVALIFVSPVIRDIFSDLFDDFGFREIPKFVIPNFRKRDTTLQRKDSTEFGYRICMLQYALEVKDPLFALDVFERVWRKDKRWKICFAGPSFEKSGIKPDHPMRKEFEKRIVKLGGAVEIEGYIDDPHSWFQKFDVILSTSRREGTHESIIEACATGCIPVFRQWPLLSYYKGVEQNFPGFRGHSSADVMAQEILRTPANAIRLRKQAIQLAEKRDISYTVPKFLELLDSI